MDLDFALLKGKILRKVKRNDATDEILFLCEGGDMFKLFHPQDCCESVYVEDICGDLEDLVGTPILHAEESTSDENPEGVKMNTQCLNDSFTWTFYRISTIKGTVVIRWYGESNGYYSESVSFIQIN